MYRRLKIPNFIFILQFVYWLFTQQVWARNPGLNGITYQKEPGQAYNKLMERESPPVYLPDFQVNENVGRGNHYSPELALLPDGNQICAWEDTRNTNRDIFAQRIGADGVPIGTNFLVNDDGANVDQTLPSVACDNDGKIMIAWTDLRNGNNDIFIQLFDSSGNKIGSNLMINVDNESEGQSLSKIAVDTDGTFLVVWENINYPHSIHAQRINSEGNLIGNNISVSGMGGRNPSVATNSLGFTMVVWQNDGIYTQLYDSLGNEAGDIFRISNLTESVFPDITTDGNDHFLVCWINKSQSAFYLQSFDSQGNQIDDNMLLYYIDYSYFNYLDLSVSAAQDDIICIAWTGETTGFYGDVYETKKFSIHNYPGNEYYGLIPLTSRTDDQSAPASVFNNAGDIVLVWADMTAGNQDIWLHQFDITGNEINESFYINNDEGSADQKDPSIVVVGNGNFVVAWNDWRNGRRDIYAQRYDSVGFQMDNNFILVNDQYNPDLSADRLGNFYVGSEGYIEDPWEPFFWVTARKYNTDGELSNSTGLWGSNDDYNYRHPEIACDSAGNFVITWDAIEINATYSRLIFAQFFDTSGSAVGTRIQVNNTPGYDIVRYPSAGYGGNGHCVIAWSNKSESKIFAQRYTMTGTPIDSNLIVSDSNAFLDLHSETKTAVDANGNFVIIWEDTRGNGDVYAQKFDSNGVAIGSNFRVHEDPTNTVQKNPDVSMNRLGYFFVVWEDYSYPNPQILGRAYKPDGTPVDSSFIINEYKAGVKHKNPSCAVYENRLFTTWHENSVPGQGWDIFANAYKQVFGAILKTEYSRYSLPGKYLLSQNYPNPFNSTTTINYTIPEDGVVKIIVYDLLGNRIRTLLNRYETKGNRSVVWDGKNGIASPVSSGIYFCTFEAASTINNKSYYAQQKIVLLR